MEIATQLATALGIRHLGLRVPGGMGLTYGHEDELVSRELPAITHTITTGPTRYEELFYNFGS